MKHVPSPTLLIVTPARVIRAEPSSGPAEYQDAPRPLGATPAEAVKAGLALGAKPRWVVVLSTDVFAQKVSLSAAQVAGLTPEQLSRALSFEVEPFSGIPVAESVTGYHRNEEMAFEVVQLPKAEHDAIQQAVRDGGAKLAGISHPGSLPASEGEWPEWLARWRQQYEAGKIPVITPPAPAPSPNRFLFTGLLLEAAAIILLVVLASWNTRQRRQYEQRNAEYAAMGRELDGANKRVAELRKELEGVEKEQAQFLRVMGRRASLLALLNELAAARPEDVVIRGIQTDGPSSLIISGLSLEAGAVDDLSIGLTKRLRGAGWTAQPRHKTGRKATPSGGPWEFSLMVTHEEAARARAIQLSQMQSE